MSVAFGSYLAWNAAVAETVFTESQAGRPVYLDLDDDVLVEIGRGLGVPTAERVASALSTAVRGVLDLAGAQHNVFRNIDSQLSKWRKEARQHAASERQAPPVIALLAAFVLAAEHMGREGAESPFSQHGYYRRLFDLLEIPRNQQDKFKTAIRESVEGYWEILARWLDGMDGARGLPSAQALGHRYVGLAISQALVRRADRERFSRAFVQAGLLPGEAIDTAEMEVVLGDWVSRGTGVLKPFRQLWAVPDVRERICEIAVEELEAWEGQVADVPGLELPRAETSRLRLVGWLGSASLLRRSAVFGLGAPTADSSSWRVTGGQEAGAVVGTVRGGAMTVLGLNALGVDLEDVLHSRVELADDQDTIWRRTPSESVLMSFDESTEVFVESRRAVHGQDHWLLLRTAIPLLAESIERFRTETGSTWRVESAGVPEGWTLCTGLRVGPAAADLVPDRWPPALRPLIPQHRLRIELTGGLRLPGNGDRYSSWAPPQIVGASAQDVLVSRVTGDDGQPNDAGDDGDRGAVVKALTGERVNLPIPEGDYVVSLDSEGSVVSPRTIRLRSPESQDAGTAGRLGHLGIRTLRDVLSAEHVDDDDIPTVVGAQVRGDEVVVEPLTPGRGSWAYLPAASRAGTRLSLKPASELTCLWTGQHRVEVEPSDDGKLQIQRYRCCGRVLVTRTYAARRNRLPLPQERSRASAAPTPASFTFRAPDHILRNALAYTASGTVASMQRLLDQLDITKRAVDLLADLDAAAFLETERDAYGRITHWAVCPPTISETDHGRVVASGSWTVDALADLARVVEEEGGRTVRRSIEDGGTCVIDGVPVTTLLEYEDTMRDVVDAGNAGHRLIDRLPRLMTAAGVSPLVEMPERGDWEVFVLGPRIGWQPVARADAPGLYRLADPWKRSYYFRPQRSILDLALLVPANLGKHLVAAERGAPLISYDEELQTLDVPLGARLPGLYERATCAASGAPPELAPDGRSHVYTSVSPRFAAKLAGRLR